MNRMMTRAALIDRYGLRLTMEQLADVLGCHAGTIYNQIAKGELDIRTYKEGSRRFASYDAVAEYLDACDEKAAQARAKKRAGG